MRIRKLEIQGFKSFVDRTVLSFDHDITAIVGPNGCGKSNTVDAIRWCIGEQSAKTLRGKSMDDVIFAGSEKRSAHSFAEVTITFDNRDGLAPPEFSSYAEIAVTRKLSRDGGSEYFLNRVPVRLMDVVSLFLGTGAGSRAYSVVEQGRVGLIVTSKPEDRRSFLEEAAGITRFKARKKAAEKRIEQTKQNLLRVGDILAEIDKSLVVLERQAKKAERYKKVRTELRDADLYLAAQRMLELVAIARVTVARLEFIESQHVGVTAALARIEAETQQNRTLLFEAEQHFESVQRKSFEADNEVRRLEAELLRTRDQLAGASRRHHDATRELSEIAGQRSLIAQESEQLSANLEALAEGEYEATMRLADADEALRELRERVSAAEQRLAEHRRIVSEAEKVLAGSEAARNALSRRLLEYESRRTRTEYELSALDKRTAELARVGEGVNERLAQLQLTRDVIADRRLLLESQIGPLRAERESVERRHSEARSEHQRVSARLNALREVAARHDGVGKGVQSLLREKAKQTSGLVADQLAVPPALAPAVAAVLADRWQDVGVATADEAVSLVRWLRSENRGRAALTIEHEFAEETLSISHPGGDHIEGMLYPHLAAEGEVPTALRALLRPVVLVATLEAAVTAWRLVGGPYVYVTRDGDVLHADGRIVGGLPEKAGAGLLGTHAEIRSLEPRAEALDAMVEELSMELESLRERVRNTQTELESSRADLHAQELALLSVDRDAKAHEAEIARMTLRRGELEREATLVDAALVEMEREDRVFDEAFREAETKRDAARDGLMTDEQEALAWRAEVERASQQVTDAKVLSARERERAMAARNTISRLERSVVELSQREERLESELAQLADMQERSGSLENSLTMAIGAGVIFATAQRDAMTGARMAFDSLRTLLTESEGQTRSVRQQRERLGTELSALELQHREEQIATEHLVDSAAERYGVILPRILGDYHMRPPPTEADRAHAEELRVSLSRMGDVNLAAIDEYNAQDKRGKFFVTQKADIEKALAQLEQAIEQMNRESRKRFRETFDAVNEHFQQLFPRLFRGGSGRLQLTNPDDLLETGVEIIAQPPGKKLVNLESMSGGEKTLTAVTLLFALFMYRPSPFCLLDEVEAALDEANVIRLNELVRDLTDRSQFIMITHNKRTMSLADVLYGVTMEEPGVSKLVGVKLKRDERSIGDSGSAVA
ncbi:MAG: chromosome segregation protein SMC [Deltaproteobacteria bacterium]|nr:chromosome segregation protein SMC [Deltaproteobacteria bacterium]